MATIKFFLVFFCLIVINDVGRTNGRNIKDHVKNNSFNRVVDVTQREIDNRELGGPNTGKRMSEYGSSYQRVVVAAQIEIGTREYGGQNSGKKVSEYLRYTGIHTPAKWCAAWVSFVFKQAGYSEPKTAWSPALFPISRSVRKAEPGVLLGIYYPLLKRIAHCGIVEEVKNDWVYSIEGNTNIAGSREGDGVYRRKRHIRSIHRFADWCKE